MDTMKTLSLKQRTAAIIAAGALAASTMFAPMAFADNSASATTTDGDTNPSTTELYVQLTDVQEKLAQNFSVTVPQQINYVAAADGTLTGPNGVSAMNIDNNSIFAVHASHLKAEAFDNWNIVADASAQNAPRDAVSVSIGTSDDPISIASAMGGDKGIALTDISWNMNGNGVNDNTDKVALTTSGKINNVDKDIASAKKFATLTWYVTPGKNVAAQPQG